MSDPAIEEIECLLDEERTVLLSGDIGALASIADRKEALVARLARQRPSGETLASLRARAERNGELLEAAMKGLRSATRRLAEIRRANGPLQTYGEDGAQRTLGAGPGSFERRA